jgi:hypothetical protein
VHLNVAVMCISSPSSQTTSSGDALDPPFCEYRSPNMHSHSLPPSLPLPPTPPARPPPPSPHAAEHQHNNTKDTKTPAEHQHNTKDTKTPARPYIIYNFQQTAKGVAAATRATRVSSLPRPRSEEGSPLSSELHILPTESSCITIPPLSPAAKASGSTGP